MALSTSPSAEATKILTRSELAMVLADLRRKAPRSKNTRLNLIVFRLACCCGLRVSEIAQLQVGDVRVEVARPHLRIRRGAAKGGKSRTVPLWWDAGTLSDIAAWKDERTARGGLPTEPFVSSLQPGREKLVFCSANDFAPPAKSSAQIALHRLPSTTAATPSSAMPWPAAAPWLRSVTQPGMPT